MAAAYRRLFRCILYPHLHPTAADTRCLSPMVAPLTQLCTFSLAAERAETPLDVARPSFTSDGNFKHSWYRKLGSSVGAVLIGQAAFFTGLSGGYAFAQNDSVSPAATSEQTEGNATGLQRIEDGSVVSNEHTVKWRIFTDNGRDFFQKRKLDEAEKLFLAALLEAKEGFGVRDPHVGSSLNNLQLFYPLHHMGQTVVQACKLTGLDHEFKTAEFYRLKKEYEKAELLYLEAIEILEESFGSNDIRVGVALHSLGMCYHLQHKFAQAQTCYERALKGRIMGVGHPEYATTMYLLAKVLSLQGKGKEAESLTKESIRILEEAGLGESPTCIQRMRYLSTVLTKSKRFAEAEIWLRKILHTQELTKGWDSLDTMHAADLLSLNFQTLGKFKESEELMERSLAAKKKILHEDHLMVAFTLVQLARLTLHKFLSDMKNANSEVATYYLARAKQLSNDSIRIAEGILNSSSKDQNKLNSTSATDVDKIGAIIILFQALEIIGLADIAMKRVLTPGLILLLRLPLEHLKHGFFKIDAVHMSDTSQPFIWPCKILAYVQCTTLRIHFKNKFGKEQDYRAIEDILHKCISLYKEPHTRRLFTKAVRHEYMRCLRELIYIVEDRQDPLLLTPQIRDLLGEARQIIEELGEES